MAASLSDKAQTLLKELHCAVLSTLNKDGSAQLTTMWYFLDEDGSIVMNTQVKLQKAKNIHRDPRITICVQDDVNRSVTLSGTVEISDDPGRIQSDLQRLIERYVKGDEARKQYLAAFATQPRIALRLKAEKVSEFLA